MIQFLGNIEAKIDAKGRVFVPAAFRKTLSANQQNTLILKKDIFQECLVLYPLDVWEEQITQLRSRLNRWNKDQQQLLRQFVIDAERLELDANGRILISKRYLEIAGIESEVRFLGVDNTIEIWTNEALQKTLLAPEDYSARLEELMNKTTENI